MSSIIDNINALKTLDLTELKSLSTTLAISFTFR